MSTAQLWLKVFVLLQLAAAGPASPSREDLERLMPRSPQHPYLHFNKDDLPVLRERVAKQSRAKAVYQRLLKESDRLLDEAVSLEVPQRFRGISPYFEDEDRYGDYVGSLARNSYILAFIYQMTGDEKYAKKSYEFADALAALDSWVATWDKFPYLYWSGKPYGAKWNADEDNEIVYSFDLDTASVCRQLAASYDWLYPVLDSYQRKRLRNALLENGILRVRGNYDYHWWAHSWRTNWLPLSFSGLGLAALTLYPEDPQLLDVVEETRTRLSRFLEEAYGEEGDYKEGVGNWVGSVQTTLLFATALRNISDGQVDLLKHPRFPRIVNFPLYTFTPPRGSVPFGDSFEPLRGNWELYNKLADEFKNRQAKWLSQFFYSFDASSSIGDPFSIIWREANVEPSLPGPSDPLSMHFKKIDWVVMRASWLSEDHPLLAAKGGAHDDPQHGHLDAGHFAIAYRGQWYVKDLGYMAPSDFGYWDHRRRFEEYFHANSLGHNVVFVNGEEQKYGPQFFGTVSRFASSESRDYASIDVSKAYEGRELKGWKRHIFFQKPHFFILLDEVECAPGSEIAVRIHPGVSSESKNHSLVLRGEKGMMGMMSLAPQDLTFKFDRHPLMPRQRHAQFSWVPYWDLLTRASGTKTYILNVFAPINDEAEAEAIRSSGSFAIKGDVLETVVRYRGREYRAAFDLHSSTSR